MPGEPDPTLFDDDFVRAAAFTEPSARERARRPGRLSARITWWRLVRAGRRRAKRDRRAMVRQWRAPEYRRRSRIRAAGRVVAVLAALAVLGGLGELALKAHGGRTPPAETTPVEHGAVPRLAAANPFEGSPAAAYADGAAGIVAPAAKATGPLSAPAVAAAYADARRRLIAAALDRRTLLGGSPDAFAHAVGPDERSYFVRNLNNPDVEKRTRWWVVTFAPHTATLAGKVIKVHGRMSAHPSALQGVRGVTVHVDYLFVYPIERPGAPGTLERLVARLTGDVFYDRRDGVTHAYTRAWSISPTPARCDVHDGFIHPAYADSAPDASPGAGLPEDPYDQSHPRAHDGKCHVTTGT